MKKDIIPSDKEGRKHGEWILHYSNGEIASIRNYKHGNVIGLWIEHTEIGVIDYKRYTIR